MTVDARIGYWREALDYALDTAGAFDRLTIDQKQKAATVLSEWRDGEAMALGDHAAPDPRDRQHAEEVARLQAEIGVLRAEHAGQVREIESRARGYRVERDRARDERDRPSGD